jgi:hypothetical protein
MSPTQVGFGSASYFDLLAARPEWGQFMALGERVIFIADGTAYEIVEGDAGPIQLPPAPTPEVTAPPAEATPAPGASATPSPAPDATGTPPPPTATPRPTLDLGICAGSVVMGICSLLAAALWRAMRR